jgi:plasmid stabilization system protein ParE
MTGYDFHPRAVNDLDEIWGFIAADNLDAADRMIGEILGRHRCTGGLPRPGP